MGGVFVVETVHPGVISADDEVRAAIIAANDGVKDRFARACIPITVDRTVRTALSAG